MNEIETIQLQHGNTLKIFPDPDPMNPRTEYDNVGKLICFHRRYTLGDKTDLKSGEFSSWNDLKNFLIRRNNAGVIIPIFMIDHSGISIRAGRDFSDCDPGCWDSGQIGFIYADKDTIRKEFSVKRITEKTRGKMRVLLTGEIELYNSYLSGDVYGYEHVNAAGEVIDSCWGFYGDYRETIVPEFKDEMIAG
jgi:hypothetical protein